MLNSYDESNSEIKIDEKQPDLKINQFNYICKPKVMEHEKNNGFDHHDILKIDSKESQIANMVHENHFKTLRNNLEVRFDVMNKNFIRAVKRELRCIYSEYLKNKGLRNSKCSLVSNNELFVWDLLENTSVRWADIQQFRVGIFSKYVIALTQFCKYKGINRDASAKEIADKVYSLLYSYSHTKFYNFISTPEIRVLILMLKERYSTSKLAALTSPFNHATYKTHIKSLLKQIKYN